MKPAFNNVLIANRGEIAVRIIRAAKELGLQTVAVYSDADAHSLAVQMADEAVRIGPAHAGKSYLDADAVLHAAVHSGAGAVHPGYGFLSENADFAERIEAAGMVYIGPTPEAIRTMGNKAAARAAAHARRRANGTGQRRCGDRRRQRGGPGRDHWLPRHDQGLGRRRRARHPHRPRRGRAAPAVRHRHRRGQGGLWQRRGVPGALHSPRAPHRGADPGRRRRAVHCFERECSLQRRRQKVWEEAPSAALSEAKRARAVRLGTARSPNAVSYRGAGTLEYLYDDDTQEFFFIEMNTRIQVEHPVTEMVTGIDLVKEMICIALGRPPASAAGRHPAGGRGHRGAHQRREPGQGLHAQPRASRSTARTRRPWRALRHMLFAGYTRFALLRLAAGQADRARRDPPDGAGTHAQAAGRAHDRRRPHDDALHRRLAGCHGAADCTAVSRPGIPLAGAL